MQVRVLLFGPAANAAGAESVTIVVQPGSDERAVRDQLARQAPAIGEHARQGRLAVNKAFAGPGQTIREGDEVALIAMVSGG